MLAEIFRFRIADFGYDVAISRFQSYRLQVLIGVNLLEKSKEPKNLHEFSPAVQFVFQRLGD